MILPLWTVIGGLFEARRFYFPPIASFVKPAGALAPTRGRNSKPRDDSEIAIRRAPRTSHLRGHLL